MQTLDRCSICIERPMEPYETAGGTFFKCPYCDAPQDNAPDASEVMGEPSG